MGDKWWQRGWRKFRSWPIWVQALCWFLLAVVVIGPFAGSSDDPSSDDDGSRAEVPEASSEPECIDIAPEAVTPDFPVDGVAEGPEDFRGQPRWYYASEGGGLWISGKDPATGESRAPTLPLNDQARSESTVGVDVPTDAPVFEGADPESDEADAAVACAQG